MQGQPTPGPGMYPPPPGGMMPPPMFPMMPPAPFGPPPRPSSGGKSVVLVLTLLLLVLSVLANVVLLGSNSFGGGSGTLQETIAEGSSDQKIAVVPLVGIIDENMSRQFANFLTRAEKDASIKAVIVEIDTPGGTVTASDEIYARLLRFKQDKKVPVVVSMGSMATSGGYYAACAADYIYAQETTLTGNIGVLMPRFNFSKLMDKYGVEEQTVVSQGAKFKNAGSNFSPEAPHERAYLQSIADNMFGRFKAVVQQGRGAHLQQLGLTVEQVADGRAFTAAEAKANGLVDQVGYLNDVIVYVTNTHGLTRPQVVRYTNPRLSLFDLMGARSPLSGGQAGGGEGVTINGINVDVDPKLLDELTTPRILYLWRGQ